MRVLDNKLYFGFECSDPDPRSIAVHTMRRDGHVEGDDSVAVVLDTYGDRRTGYFFRVNAAGARVDGMIAGSEEPKLDWDGIWDARTARTPHGWSAEIEIPARTLSFTKGLAEWGVNLERFIARDRTVMRWTSLTLDSVLYDLSRAGKLSGVGGLEQGRGFEVSPFAVGRVQTDYRQGSRVWQGQPGADVTWRMTPQLAAVFTMNTDFAETEVDSRQLNVTRFPLFFPEKRSFFLEGANQFEFGLGLGEQFIPFFSRNVGLYGGRQIPIDAGVKLNGRIGKWNIGLLDVETRNKPAEASGPAVPGTNLFASRISYDVTPKLRLGTLLTNGNPDGIHRNTLAGFDGVWRTSQFAGDKNFLIGAWAAASAGEPRTGSRTGWGFKVDYPNDLWDCFTSLNQFGESLEAGLGFLPRPGTRRFDASCEFRPRPRKDGPFRWVRQEFMEHRYYRVTNHLGQTESWRFFWAPVNIMLESGDRFEFNWAPSYEFLPGPFEISKGVTLPAGAYRFTRYRAEFETSRHRRWDAANTTWFGSFYNGRLLQQENQIWVTDRKGHWQVGAESEQNFGRLKEGTFVQRLWQMNLVYAFSPNLAWSSFLQYDTESQNVGNNMRLRWTIQPGTDLFVVWNRGWQRLLLSPRELSAADRRQTALDLSPVTEPVNRPTGLRAGSTG
ncbi:MAG: carbohydrate binding family 9 domain-containing protein [Acidobacteria bacterium]|nr:carbohydrate binding family 9 domain-containing protein [Acidobacteriota bacterium]